MKNEIKSGIITLLMTIIGFIAGLCTMEVIIVVDKSANEAANGLRKMWIKS